MNKNDVAIIVDPQNGFFTDDLPNEMACGIVGNLTKFIYGFDGEIKVTNDCHGDEYEGTIEGSKIPSHCRPGTNGVKIVKEIDDALSTKPSVIVFKKDTFGSVALAEHLFQIRDSINDIYLVGVCTEFCVISNAVLIKSYLPNKRIVVDASCCAGATLEGHNEALNCMERLHIEVIGRGNNE